MAERQLEYLSPHRLRPYPQNARTHSSDQIDKICHAIEQVTFINPIIADEHLVILAGHGRWQAALKLKCKKIPVLVIRGLTDTQKRAYRLADNRLAERAGWDRQKLAVELSELAPLLEDAKLGFEWIGFEVPQTDLLLADHVDREDDPLDQLPPHTDWPVSRASDLWVLNEHRLLCGNACQESDVVKLMGKQRACMSFSDPPYNVKIASVQGRGKRKHREFAMASGEMSAPEYVRFLGSALSLAALHSKQGSLHYTCIDWRHLSELLAAGKEVFSDLVNIVVWVKNNGGQGSFYRSQHELVAVFKHGTEPHRNNIQLGRHGRNRTNVWHYAGVNAFRTGRLDDLSVHPTVKPIALVADAIRDCTKRGDVVFDPFVGSGTTILAAERVGRRAYAVEIDPLYVDVAVRRWQSYTGRDAILHGTRKTFDQLATARLAETPRRVP